MRHIVKRLVEHVLVRVATTGVPHRLHGGGNLVLAYHNIVPDGEPISGERSLHLPQRRFAEQLDALLETGVRVVSLDEMMGPGPRREVAEADRRVAITFDDGYGGAVEAGVEELVRRDLKATIFVVPGLVDGREFWWDALSAPEGSMSLATREAALSTARGRNDEVFAWARRYGLPTGEVPEHARSASEASLRIAADTGAIRIASHTWSHPNLTTLSDEECRTELVRASDWLHARFGGPDWLSYPYGLYDQRSERLASATGLRGAFRIDGGWLPASFDHDDEFRLPRLSVPSGLSREGFVLRLAGLFCG